MVAQLCVTRSCGANCATCCWMTVDDFQPDLIAAHSLGSLVTYHFFRNDPRAAKNRCPMPRT